MRNLKFSRFLIVILLDNLSGLDTGEKFQTDITEAKWSLIKALKKFISCDV